MRQTDGQLNGRLSGPAVSAEAGRSWCFLRPPFFREHSVIQDLRSYTSPDVGSTSSSSRKRGTRLCPFRQSIQSCVWGLGFVESVSLG